jgi:hypothetical protein
MSQKQAIKDSKKQYGTYCTDSNDIVIQTLAYFVPIYTVQSLCLKINILLYMHSVSRHNEENIFTLMAQ